MYVLNKRASKHMNQKVIKLQRQTDKSIIIIRDFNTSQKWTKQKISKNRKDLDGTINQLVKMF